MSVYEECEECQDCIDNKGYRANVGIIIMNKNGELLWAKRCGKDFWQFPQGGINLNESPTQAMWRELKEEVNLCSNSTKLIAETKKWLYYKIPQNLLRKDKKIQCIGQKQKWFLLLLDCEESEICLDKTQSPEFDQVDFISYWYPIRKVVAFKRNVYRKALLELAPHAQKTLLQLNQLNRAKNK